MVQARLGSKRLPGKSLKLAQSRPLIIHLLDRLLLANLPIVLAVPSGDASKFQLAITEHIYNYYTPYSTVVAEAIRKRLVLVSGSEHDVLGRFVEALTKLQRGLLSVPPIDTVVRVTGDNPFISLYLLCELIAEHLQAGCDLSYYDGMPYGAGVEVMTVQALKQADLTATDTAEREHVTSYLHQHPELFKIKAFKPPSPYDYPDLRLTVDTELDFNNFIHRLKIHAPAKKPHSCSPPLRAVIPLSAIIASETS